MPYQIDALREKNTNVILAREEKIVTENTSLETCEDSDERRRIRARRNGARQFMLTLLERRADLEDLASMRDQRIAYGEEQWSEDWMMMRELYPRKLKPDDLDISPEEFRALLYRQIADSSRKRFEEVFCRPEHRTVPAAIVRQGYTGGVINIYPEHDNVNAFLMSPDRIPDALVESMGIVEFEEGDTPLDRLQKKKEAIGALKERLNNTATLDSLVSEPLKDGANPQQNLRLHVDLSDGSILYTHKENGEEQPIRKAKQQKQKPKFTDRAVQRFGDAFAFRRKTGHQQLRYHLEVRLFMNMHARLKTVITILNEQWKEKDLRGDIREFVSREIGDCIEGLRNRENVNLTDAYRLLDEAKNLRDKRDVENVSSAMAKIVAAVNGLGFRRSPDMTGKGGENEKDQLLIESAIAQHESAIHNFALGVDRARRNLRGLALEPRVGSLVDERPRDVPGYIMSTGFHIGHFHSMHLAPFVSYSSAMSSLQKECEEALYAGDKVKAGGILDTLDVLYEVFALRGDIETMKSLCAFQPEQITFSSLVDFIQNRQKRIEGHLAIDHLPENVRFTLVHAEECLSSLAGIAEQMAVRNPEGEGGEIVPDDLLDPLKELLDAFAMEKELS